VWRWQERFMLEGVDGLLRDKTRPSRKPPLATSVIERVVALTKSDPPSEVTHWTAAAMAKAVGVSISSVQRIWRAHGLQPHRVHLFKLSNDPAFTTKLRDIVGLYVDPPAHAIVLSIDEMGGGPHPERAAKQRSRRIRSMPAPHQLVGRATLPQPEPRGGRFLRLAPFRSFSPPYRNPPHVPCVYVCTMTGRLRRIGDAPK
jgi:hypothetical protein